MPEDHSLIIGREMLATINSLTKQMGAAFTTGDFRTAERLSYDLREKARTFWHCAHLLQIRAGAQQRP